MMALLHNVKTWTTQNITRLPIGMNRWLLALNRRPDYLFGAEYTRYRGFLREASVFYDNTPSLLEAVNRAIKEVGYYRDAYGGKKIRSVAEFEETIGFIDKDTILENYDRFVSPTINLEAYDTGTTGGTSGKPLTFIAPKKRYVVELATMHSLWEQAGYDFSVRAVIRNHRLEGDRDFLINPLTREVIFDGFRLTDDYFLFIYETLRRLKIRFIHCYPSTAYEFATFIHRKGLDPSLITAFLSGSENIFDYQLELIQNRLGIRFYNWYGHSEKLVLAGYCAGTDHYHVEPTYGYFELIDEKGRVVREPGGQGEIVGTSFHNPGMPFIRYRTGDVAELVGDHCDACGRRLPVLKDIQGRWSGNRIYNGDGTFVTTTALNLHNELYQVINGIQYLQERKGELTVLVVKSSDYREGHEASLYRHFKEKLHPETVVTIQYTDRLLRKPNGKFVHILSSVDAGALHPVPDSLERESKGVHRGSAEIDRDRIDILRGK
ncbi:MAG: phenylacetate--CoA ligase family protein [Nitrospirae bacterium]|nr:phenylacetate--CoA ligase family protein [Candidatus Manganitrophaceae bacterium]